MAVTYFEEPEDLSGSARNGRRQGDLNYNTTAPPPPPPPSSGPLATQYRAEVSAGQRDAADVPVAEMIDRDRPSWEQALRGGATGIEQQFGVSPGSLFDPSDLEGVVRQASYARNSGQDPRRWIDEAMETYRRRAASGGDRASGGYDTADSDAAASARQAGGSGAGAAQTRQYFGAGATDQFTDPISSALAKAAQQRAQELATPPGGSGQNLLEDALKQIAQSLQGGGYTPAEQETFQTQAIDPLERLRQSRKQQVMQQLSARGITLSSGVAQSMLADVDRQFDQLRATSQRELSSNIAQDSVNRQMQAVQLLGNLANAQNDRLDQSYTYQTVPLNLADRSWNQSMQLLGQNNPLSLVNPLLSLGNQQQGQSQGLQEALGYIAYLMANRG